MMSMQLFFKNNIVTECMISVFQIIRTTFWSRFDGQTRDDERHEGYDGATSFCALSKEITIGASDLDDVHANGVVKLTTEDPSESCNHCDGCHGEQEAVATDEIGFEKNDFGLRNGQLMGLNFHSALSF